MISFTYQCARTGQKVHGHVADELMEGETYEVMRLAGFSWIGKAPDSPAYFGPATILNLYRIAHSESTVG